MDKIKLEISVNQLAVINKGLKKITSIKTFSLPDNAVKSILTECYIKLEKKEIDKRNSTGNFNLNIKYHEAYFLYKIMFDLADDEDHGIWEKMTLITIANTLHKQLI